MALDQVERAFEKTAKSKKAFQRAEAKLNELKEQQIKKLEEKSIHKNEVIATKGSRRDQRRVATGFGVATNRPATDLRR